MSRDVKFQERALRPWEQSAEKELNIPGYVTIAESSTEAEGSVETEKV